MMYWFTALWTLILGLNLFGYWMARAMYQANPNENTKWTLDHRFRWVLATALFLLGVMMNTLWIMIPVAIWMGVLFIATILRGPQ